jgi:hypothetical protein
MRRRVILMRKAVAAQKTVKPATILILTVDQIFFPIARRCSGKGHLLVFAAS